jgi:light-regulated signal transduction histidine kinase (bacteriophytochrome)
MIAEKLSATGSPAALEALLPRLCELGDADGLILKLPTGPILAHGETPDPEQFSMRLKRHPTVSGFRHFTSTNLSRNFPRLHRLRPSLAGLHAEALGEDFDAFIAWFRREKIPKAGRAGRRPYYRPGRDGRPQPGTYLRAWSEKVRGEAESWADAEIQAMRRIRILLMRL